MKNALVLLTRPLGEVPRVKRAASLTVANEVILIENGVYETAEALTDAGVDAAIVKVVADDAEARRVTPPFRAIDWVDVVDAIERNKTVITL